MYMNMKTSMAVIYTDVLVLSVYCFNNSTTSIAEFLLQHSAHASPI